MNHNIVNPFEYKWLMSCEMLSKVFSTCSKRQYFSVILASNRRVLGTGYNGSPPGFGHCNEGFCPRLFDNSPNGSSYDNCIANHAEANALLWSDPHDRKGGTLIVNGPPCFSCAKLICSSGISRVICYDDTAYEQRVHVSRFFFDNGVQAIYLPRVSAEAEVSISNRNSFDNYLINEKRKDTLRG